MGARLRVFLTREQDQTLLNIAVSNQQSADATQTYRLGQFLKRGFLPLLKKIPPIEARELNPELAHS